MPIPIEATVLTAEIARVAAGTAAAAMHIVSQFHSRAVDVDLQA